MQTENTAPIEHKTNTNIDAQINQWIQENPKRFEAIEKTIATDPKWAARKQAYAEMRMDAAKAKTESRIELYNKAGEEVVKELLAKKEHKEIRVNLEKRYEVTQMKPEVKEKVILRDAKAALAAKGIDMRPDINKKVGEIFAKKQGFKP